MIMMDDPLRRTEVVQFSHTCVRHLRNLSQHMVFLNNWKSWQCSCHFCKKWRLPDYFLNVGGGVLPCQSKIIKKHDRWGDRYWLDMVFNENVLWVMKNVRWSIVFISLDMLSNTPQKCFVQSKKAVCPYLYSSGWAQNVNSRYNDTVLWVLTRDSHRAWRKRGAIVPRLPADSFRVRVQEYSLFRQGGARLISETYHRVFFGSQERAL